MSITMLRPYFRKRCEALGYKEHHEAFDGTNVPAVSAKKLYFIQIGSVTAPKVDHQSAILNADVIVQLYSKGSRDSIAVADAAFSEGEKLITESMRKDKMEPNAIKNVVLSTFSVEPFDETNDNAVVGKFEFTATVVLSLNL